MNRFERPAALLLAALIVVAAAGCGSRTPPAPVRYEIAVGATGYTPDRVQAKVGQEVTLVFTRITEEGCGTEVMIPSQGERTVPLPLRQPVEIKLTPEKRGEIVFTCGMKMFDGKVLVN